MSSYFSRLLVSAVTAGAILLPATTGAAQALPDSAISAPITDVRYDVTFDAQTAGSRIIKVRMSFGVAGTKPVVLSLPAWTPGAYELGNFARWVTGFEATDGATTGAGGTAAALDWDKLDYETWRVRPRAAGRVSVSFDYVADTLDNAMAWSRPDFALFNGTNLFLYPEGRSAEFPATVAIHTDPGWLISTGMPRAAAPRTYSASNYHDLVDYPFFIGRFDVDSQQIAGKTVRLSTYPAGSFGGTARGLFWQQEAKFFPAENAVFDEVPYSTYDVMMIFDSTSGGGSALEHSNSHVGVYSPLLAGNVLLPSITAHEQFHLWNVKRLRPVEMWPYRYDRPQPTPWLWVSEGITDYYADLALVRSAVVDSVGFLQLTQQKMLEVGQVPPVSLEDASVNTWIHPVDGTGYIYYPKGSLAGFLLDIMIRDASDDAAGLDDVMRALYRADYKQGKGFTHDDWWGTVSRLAGGKSFADVEHRYIDGREPFPWRTVLPLAGFRLRADTTHEPRLGVQTAPDSLGVHVVEVEPGSAAALAGLRSGDRLMRVGDIDVTDPSFGPRFRERYARRDGETIPVSVRRDGQPLTLSLKVQMVSRVDERLEYDPKPSAKALRIRRSILAGK